MIGSLLSSLFRVVVFWYVIGLAVLYFGPNAWLDAAYWRTIDVLPWASELGDGASSWMVLSYLARHWTGPLFAVWVFACLLGAGVSELRCQTALRRQLNTLKPHGEFGKVTVAPYSLGGLPLPTVPQPEGARIALSRKSAKKGEGFVELSGAVDEAVKLLTPPERQLAEELLQLLSEHAEHYAGLGHGVGLLEHTLNVVSEAAPNVTPDFRLPLLAALAHDVGKIITFVADESAPGGWRRKGLHSRESARILAALPGYRELPQIHQDALLLAVKYDHAPSKMPALRGSRDASLLALRVITALASADRSATAQEKDAHLERLQPEDLLWKDFTDFLREAPVLTRGKKGGANMINNPPDSPFLFLYEAAWRDAAVRRMPPEVAAALDLTRRDPGKLAKYTRILVERLRREGLLVAEHEGMTVPDTNPLWDIQSGPGEKAIVFRGVLVLNADLLWKKLNYRLAVKSPFVVKILAPNADSSGRVNRAPAMDLTAGKDVPEVNDGMKVSMDGAGALADFGLVDAPARGGTGAGAGGEEVPAHSAPAQGRRRGFAPAPAPAQASVPGLEAVPRKTLAVAPPAQEVPAAPAVAGASEVLPVPEQDRAMPEAQTAELPQFEEGSGPRRAPEQPSAEAGAEGGAEAQGGESPGAAPKEAVSAAPARDKPQACAKEAPTLSRIEARAGLALADKAAVRRFPHLKVGDKYFTGEAPEVKRGSIKEGHKYRPQSPDLGRGGGDPRKRLKRF